MIIATLKLPKIRRDAKLESKSNILPEFQPTSFHFEAASHRHDECEKSQAEKSRGFFSSMIFYTDRVNLQRESESVPCAKISILYTQQKISITTEPSFNSIRLRCEMGEKIGTTQHSTYNTKRRILLCRYYLHSNDFKLTLNDVLIMFQLTYERLTILCYTIHMIKGCCLSACFLTHFATNQVKGLNVAVAFALLQCS